MVPKKKKRGQEEGTGGHMQAIPVREVPEFGAPREREAPSPASEVRKGDVLLDECGPPPGPFERLFSRIGKRREAWRGNRELRQQYREYNRRVRRDGIDAALYWKGERGHERPNLFLTYDRGEDFFKAFF